MEAVARAVGMNGSADGRPLAADAGELLLVRGFSKSSAERRRSPRSA